jgi:hypothetical protein
MTTFITRILLLPNMMMKYRDYFFVDSYAIGIIHHVCDLACVPHFENMQHFVGGVVN